MRIARNRGNWRAMRAPQSCLGLCCFFGIIRELAQPAHHRAIRKSFDLLYIQTRWSVDVMPPLRRPRHLPLLRLLAVRVENGEFFPVLLFCSQVPAL